MLEKGENEMAERPYSNISDMPLVLTVTEVAAALGIGRHAAYDLVQSVAIPVIHIGRHIRVYRDALERFLEQN